MRPRALFQITAHRIGHGPGLRVIELHRNSALRRRDVLPQRRICTVAVEEKLHTVSGLDMRPGEKLDGPWEQRVGDARWTYAITLCNYLLDRCSPRHGQYADQQQHKG